MGICVHLVMSMVNLFSLFDLILEGNLKILFLFLFLFFIGICYNTDDDVDDLS
jgi:hypothetical protein